MIGIDGSHQQRSVNGFVGSKGSPQQVSGDGVAVSPLTPQGHGIVFHCDHLDFSKAQADEISSRIVCFKVKKETPIPSIQRIVTVCAFEGSSQAGTIDKGSTFFVAFE